MKIKFIYTLILFLILAGSALGADSVLERVQLAQDTLASMSADFRQLNYNYLTEKVKVAEGKFFYKRKGLMRWEYNSPDDQLIILGRNKVWLYDPVLENVTIQSINKVSGVHSLDFFRGTKKLRDSFNEVSPDKSYLDDEGSIFKLYLSPKEQGGDIKELQIAVDASYRIKQLVVVDNKENYRKIVFNKVSFGNPLDNNLFEFIVQDGMEIISE